MDNMISEPEAIFAPGGVTAVIVTYGKRGVFLRSVVAAALRCGVAKVVVVANGNDAEAMDPAEYDIDGIARVILVRLPQNTGSAGGFSAGLKFAMELSDCDLIWLLDDDNEPAPDALKALRSAQLTLGKMVFCRDLVLASFRTNWTAQRRLLSGVPAQLCFAPQNSCYGFHIRELWDVVTGGKRKLRHLPNGDKKLLPHAEVEYAPYGGLFLHRELFTRLDLPDKRFFLYYDDTDFTIRLGRAGARMFLVRDSCIRDLEDSWWVQRPRRRTIFSRLLMEESEIRVFYGVRNNIYVGQHWRSPHKGVFKINILVFRSLLLMFALVLWRPRRAVLVLKAMRAGLRGDFSPLHPT